MDGKVAEQMLGEDDDLIPLWYLMDEFGSRVAHSEEPNVAFENFYYVKGGLMVTVMFLLQDLKYRGRETNHVKVLEKFPGVNFAILCNSCNFLQANIIDSSFLSLKYNIVRCRVANCCIFYVSVLAFVFNLSVGNFYRIIF